jgi:hypothetical protein
MFDVRAKPTSREVFRWKRSVASPSKQRDSMDADNSQNFGGCHALVQERNSFPIRRRFFDRGLATPWRRVHQAERELLRGFDARRPLSPGCTQSLGHASGSDISIEERDGEYSASN